MSIDKNVHPLYTDALEDWTLMRDVYKGQRAVKKKRFEYLPATPGQVADGLNSNQPGLKNYDAYLRRAKFPNFVAQAVKALIGVMHHKPPDIELPEKMEPLRENATVKGESLDILMRRINEAQLITGRIGLLLDVDESTNLPYIAHYDSVDVFNWDDGAREELVLQKLNLVAIREDENVRTTDLAWEFKKKTRILILGDQDANEAAGLYQTALMTEDTGFESAEFIAPSINGLMLDFIPFVFINAMDIVPDPCDPPLLGLANLAISVYQLEADYRAALFMQGQDTLVRVGHDGDKSKEQRVGVGSIIDVPIGGDAKYIGTNSQGIPEIREAIQNDTQDASDQGGKLLDNRLANDQSGRALSIRVSATTSSVIQIAHAGAAGLQKILRMAAFWMGADPEQVFVRANTDFGDEVLSGRDLMDFQGFKNMGGKISDRTIHSLMRRHDVTELTFDEEEEELSSEEPQDPAGTDAGGNPEDDSSGDQQDQESEDRLTQAQG